MDPGPKTRALLLWGADPLYLMGGSRRESVHSAILGGAKVVVINPKRTDTAKRADLWISPRPQSDGILALGIIKVMIEKGLYDADFVGKWTVGFEGLREHVKTFSLADVERLTWVDRAQVEKAATLLAGNRPACFVVGNALERGIHAFQEIRGVYILQALVGELNVPGGNCYGTPAPFIRMGKFFLLKGSPRQLEKGLCSPFRVGMQAAYVPPQALVRALLEEKPYPIKAALCLLTHQLHKKLI
jgi:anaerobic selenocysteine-containing dehydrogenase